MGYMFSEYLINSGLELVTLAAILFTLSKIALESLSVNSNFGKRIPPEKASLAGQRISGRA